MSNLWRKFQELLPGSPLLVGTVVAHNSDGTSTVELPGGITSLRVRGQGVAISSQAFVQDGEVKGLAPELPVEQIII